MGGTSRIPESAGLDESWQLVRTESRMLGPAVNRQPGFRRRTRRAKQRSEEQSVLQTGRCCTLAADLPDQLAGNPVRCCLPT